MRVKTDKTTSYGVYDGQVGRRMNVQPYGQAHIIHESSEVLVHTLTLETTNETAQDQDNSEVPGLDGVHDSVGVASQQVQVDRTKTRTPPPTDEQPQVADPRHTTKPNLVKAKIDDINYIEVITNE